MSAKNSQRQGDTGGGPWKTHILQLGVDFIFLKIQTLGCEMQGVQFHPESIRTENGMQIVGNFLKLLEKKEAEEQALANASTTLWIHVVCHMPIFVFWVQNQLLIHNLLLS